MKVLVVGGGGREHAICWKLAQSDKITKLYCAPGNAGIAKVAECVNVGAEDIDGICTWAKDNAIDLAVIGPEVPLAMGIVDRLNDVGVKTFGPNAKCSQLEASKSLTEMAMRSRGTPRVANRMLKRVRDFAQVRGEGMITIDITKQALKDLGVDSMGLEHLDREILRTIIKRFKGGPVGIETIAASILGMT